MSRAPYAMLLCSVPHSTCPVKSWEVRSAVFVLREPWISTPSSDLAWMSRACTYIPTEMSSLHAEVCAVSYAFRLTGCPSLWEEGGLGGGG